MNNPNILISITGQTEQEWQDKLIEIEKGHVREVALFLEFYNKEQKQEIYDALLGSPIESIPLVHIRHDMVKEELEFLQKNFKTRYFTCHEENFVHHDVRHWRGFYPDIYLEMNFDNVVSKAVDVSRVGGFCVDLAHFKCGMETLSKDFEYIFKRKKIHRYFKCNHLNGWDSEKNEDMHTIHDLKDFDYLKTLPAFVFGLAIALETFNSIKEQLQFKKYLTEVLSERS